MCFGCVLDVGVQDRGRAAPFRKGAPAGEHGEASRSLSGDGGTVCAAWENAPAHETQVHTHTLSHSTRLFSKALGLCLF